MAKIIKQSNQQAFHRVNDDLFEILFFLSTSDMKNIIIILLLFISTLIHKPISIVHKYKYAKHTKCEASSLQK